MFANLWGRTGKRWKYVSRQICLVKFCVTCYNFLHDFIACPKGIYTIIIRVNVDYLHTESISALMYTSFSSAIDTVVKGLPTATVILKYMLLVSTVYD